MGIINKPTRDYYWSTSVLLGSPGFKKLLSEDHFRDIHSSLHFIDETCDRNKDYPLEKVQPLITLIVERSREYYTPEQHLTINESMIRFNGRNKMKNIYATKTH